METVAVEIGPAAGATDSLRRSLLDVCTRAAQDAVCVEARAGEESTSEVVAVVVWNDPLHVRVEVSLRLEPRRVVREISFDSRDPTEERWRAVGLVLGTLAAVATRDEQPPPEPPPELPPVEPPPAAPPAPAAPAPVPAEPPRPPPPPPPPRMAAPQRRRFVVEGSGILGSALNEGPLRVGAELGARVAVAEGTYVTCGASYSVSAGRWHELGSRWLEAFAGLSLERSLVGSFDYQLRAEALVERLQVDVSPPGTPESGARFLGGARIGADLLYWATDTLGLLAGASGRWVAGTTDVGVGGVTAATAPPVGFVVRAGVAFGFR